MLTQQTTKMIGTTMYTEAEFKDFNKVKIVPPSVRFIYKEPNAQAVTNTVTPIGGKFNSSIFLSVAGVWVFRWECDGEFASADEFEVFVEETKTK